MRCGACDTQYEEDGELPECAVGECPLPGLLPAAQQALEVYLALTGRLGKMFGRDAVLERYDLDRDDAELVVEAAEIYEEIFGSAEPDPMELLRTMMGMR